MKHMKKIVAILLVAIMTLALGVSAFAQEVHTGKVPYGQPSGTITITNAAKGQTYTLYKIFDATVSEDGEKIAYTYKGTLLENSYFAQDPDTGAITALDAAKDLQGNLTAEAVAFLGGLRESVAAAAVAEDDTITFRELEFGYYYITSTNGDGSAITVTSTKPYAQVNDKNETEPDNAKKTVDKETADVGETLAYTLSFTAVNNIAKDGKTDKVISYIIHDDHVGVRLNNDIKVTVDGKEIQANDSFDGENNLVIEWVDPTQTYSLYNSPAEVVVTYTGIVTEEAINNGKATNKATFKYVTKDKPDEEEFGDDETVTLVFSIDIDKLDSEDRMTKLDGAKFVLQNAENKYYKYNVDEKKVEWVDRIDDATVVETVNGETKIEGIAAGTYNLIETVAPRGYNLPKDPFVLEIVKGAENRYEATLGGERVDVSDTSRIDAEILNSTGVQLPETGGAGTALLILLGMILFGGTALVLVSKKRMYNQGY